MSSDALDIDNEAIDPTFNLDARITSGKDHGMEKVCDDFVSVLDRYR